MLARGASAGLRLLRQSAAAACVSTARGVSSEATFEVQPLGEHLVETGPSRSARCSSEQALALHTAMQTVRQMETAADQLFREHRIRGMLHLYSGQEATCVGIQAAMLDGDSVITSYRCHGWAHMMGLTPREILLALTSRATSRTNGKGGSMHLYSPDHRFYGGMGIVGSQCPIGVGIAFAHKYNNTRSVCITMYGEGAANQGQLSEAMNLAALWRLPVVFVCENNHYSYYTADDHVTANTNYYCRGDIVPGVRVDGMDVLAVREAAQWATDLCRAGRGPAVLESLTYRFSGHSVADPGKLYRPEEEVQEAMAHDPIAVFRQRVLAAGLLTEQQLEVPTRQWERCGANDDAIAKPLLKQI
ncbi:pyruvate dehydrogenase E1 component subunit alpha type II, mitochondrial-like [Pollicipes pollicipes]|uniref:pyruvate dehydrogenase E1 component subunit alpha type II, mitochondrial-like n=1 Tax=Pollicipes pollicipes TaxID=41117 RepID=UPI001884E230|nr:pyruvate dehydrogenase E1 component subunit alpha type II, mitochondrial-like [Pollicipes pollicipes]